MKISFQITLLTGSKFTCYHEYKIQFNTKYFNILYWNGKLYIFGKTDSPLFCICNSNIETDVHLFCECVLRVTIYGVNLDIFLNWFRSQTAIDFGFLAETNKCIFKISNHLLLFKIYVYKSWEKGSVDISRLINEIRKIKTHEKI